MADGAAVPCDIDAMFRSATTHDVRSLLEMQSCVKPNRNSTLATGYPVALYIASASLFEEEFVRTFPTSREGVNRLYTLRHPVDNTLFAFDAIGEIARSGNDHAISKLFSVYEHADGVIAEIICDAAHKALLLHPVKVVKAMAGRGQAQQRRLLTCFDCDEYSGEERTQIRSAVLSARELSRKERTTAEKILVCLGGGKGSAK